MLILLFSLLLTDFSTEQLCLSFCKGEQMEISESMIQGPDQLAYLGAFTCMSAEDSWNPVTKLDRFNKGKDQIAKAIQENKESFHARFCRYVIQFNTPSFLGYNDNLEEDRAFLKEQYKLQSNTWSTELRSEIRRVLTETEVL